MNTWQQHIVAKIIPSSQITVVFDPHGLVRDEFVQSALCEIGYTLYVYVDAITFRYDFEATIKPAITQNRQLYMLIIVPFEKSARIHLPYVLIHQHECIEISFVHLYPMLHPLPLSEITLSELRLLWPHGSQLRQVLDVRQTRTYILNQVYQLHDDQLHTIEDIVTLLCHIHYNKQHLPLGISTQLMQHPTIQRYFDGSFIHLIESATRFFVYLHEQWRIAAQRYLASIEAPNNTTPLNFTHQQLRLFVVTFFQNQTLTPIAVPYDISIQLPDWVSVGIVHDSSAVRQKLLATLQVQLSEYSLDTTSQYQDWLNYAQKYAHYIDLMAESGREDIMPWQVKVDAQFYAWLQAKYHYLHSLPPQNPVMVHHIAHYVRRYHTQNPQQKLALVVIDGMGMSQWRVIQQYLTQQLPRATINERAVFAWIPTLTNISRQSIFAGQSPVSFAGSISTTSSEKRLWQQLWQDFVPNSAVTYAKSLGSDDPHHDIDQILNSPHISILGLVVDSIDEIMHGATLGMQGFQQQVHLWSKHGYLAGLLQELFDRGFEVWLTADHGSCLATGTGTKNQGALVEKKSARALIYSNSTLRDAFKANYSIPTNNWPQTQLPADYCALITTGFNAFAPPGQRIICHGGTSISEVIVPFIHIRQE